MERQVRLASLTGVLCTWGMEGAPELNSGPMRYHAVPSGEVKLLLLVPCGTMRLVRFMNKMYSSLGRDCWNTSLDCRHQVLEGGHVFEIRLEKQSCVHMLDLP
jgi:hypothetical protein